MTRCRNCGSESIHASRTRTNWERIRRQWTGKRPYRCHTCQWRGWGVETEPRFPLDEQMLAAQAIAAEPIDLRVLEGPASKPEPD
jgi:hypothetical protein